MVTIKSKSEIEKMKIAGSVTYGALAEIEKTGSITKAAANLFMGQPNLSKAVRELENELGIKIFRRTTKGVEPTAEGRVFIERAKSVLAQFAELEQTYKTAENAPKRLSAAGVYSEYISEAKLLNTVSP